MTPILYAYTFPTRAERVLWLAAELGLTVDCRRLDPRAGEQRSTDFLALNPSGKVPVWVEDGQVLTESLAILEHLARKHRTVGLWPDEADQDRYRQLLCTVQTELEAPLWTHVQATLLQGIYRWPDGTAAYAARLFHRAAQSLAQQWQPQPLALGTRFGVADVYVGSVLLWATQVGLALPEVWQPWLSALQQRPAYQQAYPAR